MDLIDRDALKDRMKIIANATALSDYAEGYRDSRMVMLDAIDDAPTIDAEPVVRCGECKYMKPNGHCTQFADDKIWPSVSDYCSAGERKNGGADNG